jgi:GT2 family glycosyltransferase
MRSFAGAPAMGPDGENWASDVCLTISSFRNDASVERLLTAAHEGGDSPFARIIVVDSMGTGRIPELIAERGWSKVLYRSYHRNLGSAGNLSARLRLSAEEGANFCCALNHDGDLKVESVRRLVEFARENKMVGAVYPLRQIPSREGKFDVTGESWLPMPSRGQRGAPTERAKRVFWSSSNGALYNLEPVRKGLLPWGDLWMGWEDLGYGWLLERSGYTQYILTSAVVDDNYEYEPHDIGPWRVRITDKPAWYAYYQIRNLILVTRRNDRSFGTQAVVAGRVLLEYAVTTALRKSKLKRYRLLTRGLIDGLLDRSGKWLLP